MRSLFATSFALGFLLCLLPGAASAEAIRLDVAAISARVVALVKEQLGLPQPKDFTTDRPVALVKRAGSTMAETMLRRDADALDGLAKSSGDPRFSDTAVAKRRRPTSWRR